MTEGDKPLAALRAQLTGDGDGYMRVIRSLDRDEDQDFMFLLSAAFLEMADQTFGSAEVPAAVVEWVARVRSTSDAAARIIDPVISEQVILFALGLTEGNDLSGKQVRDAELLLLPIMVHDQQLDGTAVDELLAAARKLTRK